MSSVSAFKNVVVVGGSFAGVAAVTAAKSRLPSPYRLVLIEPRATFHFTYAFPRAAVLGGFEPELFPPYDKLFASPDEGIVVRAKAVQVTPTHVVLDRPAPALGPDGVTSVPFEYLIWAAGASHPSPTELSAHGTSTDSITELRGWQDKVRAAKDIIVIGGGGSGVQLAAEVKEKYGAAKNVTLVHSRDKYFAAYGDKLDPVLTGVLDELNVAQVKGERVVVPEGGFKNDGTKIVVKTTKGREIESDLQIPCTGLTPNTSPLASLSPSILDSNGYIPILPTSQLSSPQFPHIFAAGDTTQGVAKTAKEARRQAGTAVANILTLIAAKSSGASSTPVLEKSDEAPLGIHLVMAHTYDVFGRARDPVTGLAGAMKKVYDRSKPESLGARKVWESLGYVLDGGKTEEQSKREGRGRGEGHVHAQAAEARV
ncbi:FAD/NAD(P)-binding domain-containing protein [Gonapodya prolifera JEL478]|uniref:FAD/NAD(P)-binding domain-containing protein n=1 Tax=Gonapodya prolifera (strain JEL478) TaxID=1344416 RepID=A0A139AFU4_GONPJ|nr:FAD/NAD(P)-binding domain-containing protein [Gonapodya prolifera JEL478]|eukprot:KXS15569.1 FAD/NAD(P)-binding domain-containing protein [Gonapodya prolifera JEL478]